MTRHPFDPVSLVLGLVVTGVGVLGLVAAAPGVQLAARDLRAAGPVVLVVLAALVLAVSLRPGRRGEGRPDARQDRDLDTDASDATGADVGTGADVEPGADVER